MRRKPISIADSTCPNPPTADDPTVELQFTDTSVGAAAVYFCLVGEIFTGEGSDMITSRCLDTFQWSVPTIPACQGVLPSCLVGMQIFTCSPWQ